MTGLRENSDPTIKAIPLEALALVFAHVDRENIDRFFRETGRRLDGCRWQHLDYPLTVISSVCYEDDGKLWLHVSYAHQKRMPTYGEMQLVKSMFIGEDKYAMMVLPPKDKYVNLHKYCLHLWHCLEGHPLPEFSGISPDQSRTI
jgi:hypothetical protein